MRSLHLTTVSRAAWLSLIWLVLMPRASRAEGTLSYKFQSWQEDGGRIRVDAHYAQAEQSLGTDTKVKVTGLIDTIAGATPTGQPAPTPGGQVPLTEIDDRRNAGELNISHQFPRINLSAGYARSVESDYVSDGWSLNTLTDFNQKNTTFLLGAAGTDDDVRVFFQTPRESKRSLDVIAGITQLLDSHTSVTLNLTRGRATGYLADPYKLVEKNTEILPGVFLPLTFGENRPAEREKWVVFAGLNRDFPALRGALDASYRFYDDDYGITSHTVALEWFQKLGEHIIVRPGIRYYEQSAADFYRLTLDGTNITPGSRPNAAGPFYSADYRLSKLRTVTYGLKVIWTLNAALSLDAAFERYEMEGRDGLTPRSAYTDADVTTLGARLSW